MCLGSCLQALLTRPAGPMAEDKIAKVGSGQLMEGLRYLAGDRGIDPANGSPLEGLRSRI